ncbi:hypothetical protein [Paraburkholderia sp. SIMBA_030]|uniref:hypothetical protein n=1 Tax=Paraburkholderia sp. SIMBA_030 TaxID=3085773 RepID=UPI00397D1255
MPGFKRFSNAAVVIAGAKPAHRIRKRQFDFVELGFTESVVPAVFERPCLLHDEVTDRPLLT